MTGKKKKRTRLIESGRVHVPPQSLDDTCLTLRPSDGSRISLLPGLHGQHSGPDKLDLAWSNASGGRGQRRPGFC